MSLTIPPYGSAGGRRPDEGDSEPPKIAAETLKSALRNRLISEGRFTTQEIETGLQALEDKIATWLSTPDGQGTFRGTGPQQYPPQFLRIALFKACQDARTEMLRALEPFARSRNAPVELSGQARRASEAYEPFGIGRSSSPARTSVPSNSAPLPLDVVLMTLLEVVRTHLGLPSFLAAVRNTAASLEEAIAKLPAHAPPTTENLRNVIGSARKQLGLLERVAIPPRKSPSPQFGDSDLRAIAYVLVDTLTRQALSFEGKRRVPAPDPSASNDAINAMLETFSDLHTPSAQSMFPAGHMILARNQDTLSPWTEEARTKRRQERESRLHIAPQMGLHELGREPAQPLVVAYAKRAIGAYPFEPSETPLGRLFPGSVDHAKTVQIWKQDHETYLKDL
jgi:hypothetical protein